MARPKLAITLRQSSRANNLCEWCGAPKDRAGSYCIECCIRKISKDITGTKTNWQSLQIAYERQQGKCAYTGVDLIPGLTASVDHIIPTSRGGTHDESNLQWVTKQMNCMKTDMTHDEFLSTCRLILLRADAPPSGVKHPDGDVSLRSPRL